LNLIKLDNNELLHDILTGFSSKNKYIPFKYLYDNNGCKLYNKITHHNDYYLTNCEIEIINQSKNILLKYLNTPFNLIELGPGEGTKTNIFLTYFLQNQLDFNFIPIDISSQFLNHIRKRISYSFPILKCEYIQADYFNGLKKITSSSQKNNFVLFLGSSIGNFSKKNLHSFLQQAWNSLHHGDYILIGFDLRKDISIIKRAYNDSDGLTRDFNLNLLLRLNKELNANFNLMNFVHIPIYNEDIHAMESYLRSIKTHTVYIKALDRNYLFTDGEQIHIESSFKYDFTELTSLAKTHGFNIINSFFDSKKYFVDSLWQVNKE
jgi:L-histidine N-alpha-methyltransferase